MKRSIAFILAFMVIISAFTGLSVSAESEIKRTPDMRFSYRINDDDTISIVRYYDMVETNIVIPEEIEDKKVVDISGSLFSEQRDKVSITIPESMKTIDVNAFYKCTKIQNVYYNAVNCACSRVFKGKDISKVYIGENVQVICENAFVDGWIGEVIFSENSNLKRIEKSAFEGNFIYSISIPDSVEYIGESAFKRNTYLRKVELPKNIHSISKGEFYWCDALKTFDFSNIEVIESTAFEASGLTELINCNKLKSIGEAAFYASDLTNADLPDTLRSIGRLAFNNCAKLENISIPQSVEVIGESAFSGCTSLKSISIPYKVKRIEKGLFHYCENLESVTLSEGLEYIGDQAFKECIKLKDINIPSTLKEMGERVFEHDRKIEKMVLSENLKTMKPEALAFSTVKEMYINTGYLDNAVYPDAFTFCEMGNLHIGDNVKSITENAFLFANVKGDIEIGKNIESVGADVFSGTDWYKNQPGGILYLDYILLGYKSGAGIVVEVKDGTRVIADKAFYDSEVVSVTMPSTVSYVGKYAFSNCRYLADVEMSPNVTVIREGTFKDSSFLPEFAFSDNIKAIEKSAFENCTKLKISAYSNKLASIGDYAFSNCPNISNFNMGSSLTKIGAYAFNDCDKLTINKYSPVLKEIGDYAFFECDSLESFNCPYSLEAIGDFSFARCYELKSFEMNDYLKNVGSYALYGCTNLTDVKLGNNLPGIPFAMFELCKSLENIYIPDSVKFIGGEAFFRTAIKEFLIPKSVNNIGGYAFSPVEDKVIYGRNEYTENYCKEYGYNYKKAGDKVFTDEKIFSKGDKEYFVVGSGKVLYFGSSNENVVKCSGQEMEANQAGTAVVKIVLSTGYIYKINVTVVPSVSEKNISMNCGSEKTITVNTGVKSYKSSNTKVATVKNGKITAINKGSAVITAVFSDGSLLMCDVTVKTAPKLNKTTVKVKKGKTVSVKLQGKAKSVKNIYTNTKVAKIVSNKNATTLKVKGLKKGTTTLKIKVNNVKTLKLKVKVTK